MVSIKNKIVWMAVITLVLAAGGLSLTMSRANAPVISVEPEQAARLSGVVPVQDNTASSGSAIRFTNANMTTIAGKPDSANTGIPGDTSLTVVSGNTTISQPGIYDAKDYRGFVTVTASNVALKRSKFNGGTLPVTVCDPTKSGSGATGAIVIGANALNVVIEDSEIDVATPHPLIDGLRGANFTLRRSEVTRGVDGIGIYGTGNVIIENSWIHDLNRVAQDQYHKCTPSHNDAVQIHYGSTIALTGNTIAASTFNHSGGNAAIMINQNGGKITRNVTLDQNWIDYGGCSVNVYENGLAAIAGLRITGNRFGKNQSVLVSGQPCTVIVSAPTKTEPSTVISGNVWEDGSQPVPTIRTAN